MLHTTLQKWSEEAEQDVGEGGAPEGQVSFLSDRCTVSIPSYLSGPPIPPPPARGLLAHLPPSPPSNPILCSTSLGSELIAAMASACGHDHKPK